jgi:RNA polymerase sigma factor (sigma-70 family)
MATNQMSKVIHQLRSAVLLRNGDDLTDGQLLGAFIDRRDDAAFAALVQRHGSMVWGVCRRLLNHHDAEDAFQAAFLVLFRKASSIVPRQMVSNWLYGVAHQTALQARRTTARRTARERHVIEMPDAEAVQPDRWIELKPLLDEELSRLPDKYRGVIVLCDLEGKTRHEAARHLGCPEGTVGGRLARARVMLAKRLAQRGVVLSGGAMALALSQGAASAGAPTSVVSSTIKAATLLTAGQAAADVISVKAAALAEGVMKTMLLGKLKAMTAVLIIVAGFVGAVGLVYQSQATEPPIVQQAQEKPEARREADKRDQANLPAAKKDKMPKTDEEQMQGIWLIESLEEDGNPSPDEKAITEVEVKDDKIIFKYGKLKKESAATFKLDASKKPKAVDLTAPGETKPYPGIYEITGDTLKLCWRENLQGAERPKAFSGKATAMRLAILKRKPVDDRTGASDLNKLQGTWQLVTMEFDGVRIGEGRPEIKDSKLVIEKSSFTLFSKLFHSPNVPLEPEDVKVVGTLVLDAKKNPKEITLTWENDPWTKKKNVARRGIFILDGDLLKICFSTEEDGKTVPTEFSANFGSKRSFLVLKSIKKAK